MSALTFNDGVLFQQIIKGKNFITPEIIGYFNNDTYVVELSKGLDFVNIPVYGITVINQRLEERCISMDKMFNNYTDAIKYLKEIVK